MMFKGKFLSSIELELQIRIICYITEIIGANHTQVFTPFPVFKMETVLTEPKSPNIHAPNLNVTIFRSAALFVRVVWREKFSEQNL